MAKSYNPQQSPPPNKEQIPQQDPQKQQPDGLIPFELSPQVGFNIEDIIFNPNNEVALLYPPHLNSKYFKALKKNQLEGPSFTNHMLDIYKANAPMAFKAPKPSSKAEKKVTQCTKPGATSRRRKK
ncbi:hypothetical protein Tco_0618607 [Tanacetum coccineum]